MNVASPPAFVIKRTVSCPPSLITSDATTLALSRANANAVARPIPEPAPVTSATFSANLPAITLTPYCCYFSCTAMYAFLFQAASAVIFSYGLPELESYIALPERHARAVYPEPDGADQRQRQD